MMSLKRRETAEAAQAQLGKLEAKDEAKDGQIHALHEQVESLAAAVWVLQEQATQVEGVPKMMSAKRRQAEETMRSGLASLETQCTEKEDQLSNVHKNVLCMLEHLQ